MPYDTRNRWVHAILVEADLSAVEFPWSRRAKHARRMAKAQ